jgi:hypothetical protein
MAADDMPLPFQRCTRALAIESDGRSALTLALAALLSGLTVAWCFWARVSVFETTDSARVEAQAAIARFDAEARE